MAMMPSTTIHQEGPTGDDSSGDEDTGDPGRGDPRTTEACEEEAVTAGTPWSAAGARGAAPAALTATVETEAAVSG
jgi:hypothetical protein